MRMSMCGTTRGVLVNVTHRLLDIQDTGKSVELVRGRGSSTGANYTMHPSSITGLRIL